MKQKKINHFNIKLKLTLFVLAFSLLPILYISIYVNLKFTKHLQDQAYLYYSNILKQITQNVDSTFLNYSIKLSDVTKTDNFKTIINWPEYKTKIEERFYLAEMGEDINIPKINSLIWNVYTNINGLFAIIETNRYSITNDTEYKVHYLVDDHSGFRIDYNELLKEPLYKRMVEEGGVVYGTLSKKTLSEVSNRSVILYPYNHKTTNKPDVILVSILYDDYIKNIIDHPQIKQGTVYLLDINNNVITQTHPSLSDYYKYDKDTDKYILEGDDVYNEFDMSFYDYQKLNTRQSILKKEEVKEALLLLDADRKLLYSGRGDSTNYSEKFVKISDKGIDYLLVSSFSLETGAKLVYFIPLSYINKPIFNSLLNIGIAVFFMFILIFILGIWLSGHFTKPIILLAKAMVKSGKGELNIINSIKTNDEIQTLYDSYNIMIKDMVMNHGKIEAEEEELKVTRLVAITALARLAEYRDESTGRHLERVREYTRILVTELRKYSKYSNYLTDKYIEDITSSSVLHDIGKVGIENQVLLKPGKLTAEEYEVIKGHAIIGGDALSNADHELGIKSFLTLAKEICYYHHEKYDGTGYPKGLKGDDIPLSARITALADVYDALTADRCYRKALSHVEAADIIINKDVGHFDPDIVLCFIENQHKFIEIKNLYRNIELKDHMIN